VDIVPTILDLLDAPSLKTDGVSLRPAISNPANDLDLNAFNETGIWITNVPGLPEGHLNYPDLLQLLDVPDDATGTLSIREQFREITLEAKDRMVRDGRWKLVYQPLEKGARLALYDVVSDPGCTRDLAADNAEVIKRLYPELVTWMRSGTPRPFSYSSP
jgi:arylsulfatase A-like enzyme